MKKLFALLFVAGTMSIVACGPSAEEKAKMEAEAKAKMDSLFNMAEGAIETPVEETVVEEAPVEEATEGATEAAPAEGAH